MLTINETESASRSQPVGRDHSVNAVPMRLGGLRTMFVSTFAHLLATTQTEDQVQCGLLLDVVVGQSAAILQLLTSEDKALLVRWDALLVLDL
jgi:hypothetical protein